MQSIKLAKNIGFCSGVRRAINIVEDTLSTCKGTVYSLGLVIHNPQVIRQLESKGLRMVKDLSKLDHSSILVLPSHGSPGKILDAARKKKLKLIDVTCPYVSSVQNICRRLSKQGFKVLIIGDKHHPEVRALRDVAPQALVLEKKADIPSHRFINQKIGIISQTTQAKDTFFAMVGEILAKNSWVKEVYIFNTICLDTARRQEEVSRLAKKVDALLVAGSSTSANTKRLFSIGRKINPKTYLVENQEALSAKQLSGCKTIGLISGGSTPDWLVEKIVKKIREEGRNVRRK